MDILRYGRSEKCRISGPTWAFQVVRTVALMDALCLAATHPEPVRTLVITGSMPVPHGPLAPLPENGRRGRNVRDVHHSGDGPTREKMRTLLTTLEWYGARRLPEETRDMRRRQSLDPDGHALAAMSDRIDQRDPHRGDRRTR